MHSIQSIEQKLLIIFFGATIAVMSTVTFLSWSVGVLPEEARFASPLPRLALDAKSLIELPQSFEKFFNDRLAFRDVCVRWHNFIKVRLFGISTEPHVVIGRDGWLFN